MYVAMGLVLTSVATVVSAESKQPPTTAPTTQQAAAPINKKCPITGEPVDPKVTYVYQGKTVGFCCSDCIATFKKDPAKYMATLK
jgi:YHS domain-containing protein